MSDLLYSSVKEGLLYSYKIVDGTPIVFDSVGAEVVRGMSDATAKEKKEWAINVVNQYNKEIVKGIYKTKITELDDVYVEAELGRVTLSDGNVFNASKTRGDNPNRSLNNTIDLVKKGVEFAIYFKQPSIILSDADNHDVTYPIVYTDGVGDNYITPVVEIGMYMNLFFTLKRTICNSILVICSDDILSTNQAVDVDALLAINPRELFITGRLEGENVIKARAIVEPTPEPDKVV